MTIENIIIASHQNAIRCFLNQGLGVTKGSSQNQGLKNLHDNLEETIKGGKKLNNGSIIKLVINMISKKIEVGLVFHGLNPLDKHKKCPCDMISIDPSKFDTFKAIDKPDH